MNKGSSPSTIESKAKILRRLIKTVNLWDIEKSIDTF